MKTVTGSVLVLATALLGHAEVLTDDPVVPAVGAPAGPSSLTRLLSEGTGVIEFVGTVYYDAEREPEANEDSKGPILVARGRKSFPFQRGRYHAPDMGVEESRTLISYTPDGWLEIRREGKSRVLLVPPAKVAEIKATLPEEQEPKGVKNDPGDEAAAPKGEPSVHLRWVPVDDAFTVLKEHRPALVAGVEGIDLRTNRIRLAPGFVRGEELRKELARLDAPATQVVLQLELRMPGPDGKPKVVTRPVVTVADGGVARVSSGDLEVDIKAKVLRPDAEED